MNPTGHRFQLHVHDGQGLRALARAAVALLLTVATPALSSPESDVEQQAQALFADGEAAYAAGRFDVALDAFLAAHEKVPVPALLFNIGQCHRKLGHHEQAADLLQRYLDEETDTIANRAEVEELVAEERAMFVAAQAAPAPAAPVPASASAPASALYEQPLFWGIAGGVALAALVGGVVAVAVSSTPPPSGTLGTFDLRAR